MKRTTVGKRVVCPIGSKKHGMALVQLIKETLPRVRIKFYHDGMSKELRESLKQVNEAWLDVDFVMFTGCITQGIDFNEHNVFHCAVVSLQQTAAKRVISCKCRNGSATTKDKFANDFRVVMDCDLIYLPEVVRVVTPQAKST